MAGDPFLVALFSKLLLSVQEEAAVDRSLASSQSFKFEEVLMVLGENPVMFGYAGLKTPISDETTVLTPLLAIIRK